MPPGSSTIKRLTERAFLLTIRRMLLKIAALIEQRYNSLKEDV